MMLKKGFLLGCFLFMTFSLFAGELHNPFARVNEAFASHISDSEASKKGQFYRIWLMTISPGDKLSELYLWWGHAAIVVENLKTGSSMMYDYGIFSTDDDKVITSFMGGRIKYFVEGREIGNLKWMANRYRAAGRWVVLQQLDLEPAATYKMVHYLNQNIKTGNNDYKYHFFNQNCCTRIRDIIDYAVGGQLYDNLAVPAARNRRESAREYLQESFLADWALNFLLSGNIVDQPVNLWDQLYLPYELMKALDKFSYKDSKGKSRHIIKQRENYPINGLVNQDVMGLEGADKDRIIEKPLPGWILGSLAGVLCGAIAALLFLFGTKSRVVRVLGGIYNGIVILLLFVIGSVLFHMVVNSDHDVTWYNLNLILINPFTMLIGFILSILYAADVGKSKWVYTGFWICMAVASLILLGIRLSGVVLQDNLMALSALIPWFGFMAISGIFRDRINQKI